jgi:hypothetical protein
MTTYTFSAGRQQITLTNAATTVFNAATNAPFFLSDWVQYRASGTSSTSTTLAYPLKIDAATSPFTFNGGRFYGNIGASIDWDDFYEGGRFTNPPTKPRFNSALCLLRNGVRGTFNDVEFGIRDDLNSGYVDGFHLAQGGNCTFNRPRVWLGRDDWIECDDVVRSHTINDGFFENQFVWLSGTGNIPNGFFYANNCLVHFRRWLFRGGLTHGPFLKVDSATASPNFRFNNVCMVIDYRNTFDNNRVKSALAKTQATGGSRLLVLNGTHQDRELITRFQTAGFSVLEDGGGTAATQEWLNRKTIFLNGASNPPPPPLPPPAPSLSSPVTFSVQAG